MPLTGTYYFYAITLAYIKESRKILRKVALLEVIFYIENYSVGKLLYGQGKYRKLLLNHS